MENTGKAILWNIGLLITLHSREKFSEEKVEKATKWISEFYAANQMSFKDLNDFCTKNKNKDWLVEQIFGKESVR
jgi:hypothetical protein